MDRGNAAYEYEMSDDDHCKLSEILKGVRGKVLISGYPCDLYDSELYADWNRVDIPHFADGARPRTEVLWMNYVPQVQKELFSSEEIEA